MTLSSEGLTEAAPVDVCRDWTPPGDPDCPPKVALFIFALCMGPLVFLANLYPFLSHHGTLTEPEEWSLFKRGWITLPIVALALCAAALWARRRAGVAAIAYDRLLAAANMLLAFAGIAALFLLRNSALPLAQPRPVILMYAGSVLLVNLLIAASMRFRRCELVGGFLKFWTKGVFCSLPLMLFLAAWMVSNPSQAENEKYYNQAMWRGGSAVKLTSEALIIGGLVGIVGLYYEKLGRLLRIARIPRRVWDVVVCLLLLLLTVNMFFPNDHGHMDPFMGPTNDLMKGRTLLWDIDSAYGIGVIYFLAGVFGSGLVPFTLEGFSIVLGVLYGFTYMAVYATLRISTRQIVFPVMAMVILMAASFFGTIMDIHLFPGMGPLRFGLTVLLLLLVSVRLRWPRFSPWLQAGEGVVVGISSVWSIEVAVYNVFTYGAVVLCEAVVELRDGRFSIVRFLRRLSWAFGFIIFFHALLTIHVLVRSGHWPQWGTYIGHILYYSGWYGWEGFPWQPWSPVVFITFAGVMWAALALTFWWGSVDQTWLPLVAGLVLASLTQFTYFVQKSSMQFLTTVMTAPLCLYTLLSARACDSQKPAPAWVRRACGYAFFAIVAGVIVVDRLEIRAETQHCLLVELVKYPFGKSNLAAEWDYLWNMPLSLHEQEAISLIRKYAPGRKTLALFLSPNLTLSVLRQTGTMNTFPIAHMLTTHHVKAYTGVLPYKHDLKPGDYLFLCRTPKRDIDIENELLDRLSKEFRWVPVEETSPHIEVFRLEKP
jgi:hypothetical protein